MTSKLRVRFQDSFRKYLPHAAIMFLELIGTIIGVIYTLFMAFSGIIAGMVGVLIARERIMPMLDLAPGWWSTTVEVVLSIVGAVAAVGCLWLVEVVALVVLIGVVVCFILLCVSAVDFVKARLLSSRHQS